MTEVDYTNYCKCIKMEGFQVLQADNDVQMVTVIKSPCQEISSPLLVSDMLFARINSEVSNLFFFQRSMLGVMMHGKTTVKYSVFHHGSDILT